MNVRKEEIERAINLIVQSCSEDVPIIDRFDALFEVAKGTDSESSPLIVEIAKGRGLDMKYLSDGASFLVSRLHFSNDYYTVLGMRPNATPTDIKKRWRELIELYHPDRYEGNAEWTAERAKRVNEAYSILKDEEKRKEYDERLIEDLKEKSPKPTTSELKTLRAKKRVPSKEFFIFGMPFSEMRHKIPGYITAFYIAASFLFLIFIFLKYYPIDSGSPKTTIQPKVEEKETPHKDITPIFPDLSSERREATVKEETKVEEETPITNYESPKKFRLPKSQVPERSSSKGSSVTPKTEASIIPPRPSLEKEGASQNLPSENGRISQSPPLEKGDGGGFTYPFVNQRPSAVPEKTLTKDSQEATPMFEVKTGMPFPDVPTPDETKAFIKVYIETYEKGDIERFMILFSRSAIENDAIDYNGIHHIYTRTFEGKKNKYQITSLDIRPMEDYTLVSGIYYIEHITPSTGQRVKAKGKIIWKLVREEGRIRILRADYRGQ